MNIYTACPRLHMHAWCMHVGIRMQGMHAPTYAFTACMHAFMHAWSHVHLHPTSHKGWGREDMTMNGALTPYAVQGIGGVWSPCRPPSPELLPTHPPNPPYPTAMWVGCAWRRERASPKPWPIYIHILYRITYVGVYYLSLYIYIYVPGWYVNTGCSTYIQMWMWNVNKYGYLFLVFIQLFIQLSI